MDGREGDAQSTLGQVSWLRERHDGVLDGLLLPGGKYPFGLTRMFADFSHRGEVGVAFEKACETLGDYWRYQRLGLPDWDWQAGLPPGWAELAAETPRVRDGFQLDTPKPKGWLGRLGVR
jgi:hypothetical protein